MADGCRRFNDVIRWGRWELDLTGRTLVMGILNVTPDSFSDGGTYLDPQQAVAQGLKMVDEGADIIDIGGQSTRPGSEPITAEAERDRVLPVVAELADTIPVPISIDTTESAVAEPCLDAGAAMINDVSAARHDQRLVTVAAERQIPLVLMHMQGTPATMQARPQYTDVVAEIKAFLRERFDHAVRHGVDPKHVILDVGIGFGKRLEHNLALLAHIDEFFDLGPPILVGHSRKRFLGDLLNIDVTDRDAATLAAGTYLAAQRVHIIRVHDVRPTRQAVELIHALRSARTRRQP